MKGNMATKTIKPSGKRNTKAAKTTQLEYKEYTVTQGGEVALETNSREAAFNKAKALAESTQQTAHIDRTQAKTIAYVTAWGVVHGEAK